MSILPHPAFDAAEKAFEAIMRARVHSTSKEIRELIRIEVDHDQWYAMLSAMTPRDFYDPREREGPPTYNGFAIYRVDRLPEPGWRVIAPDQRILA